MLIHPKIKEIVEAYIAQCEPEEMNARQKYEFYESEFECEPYILTLFPKRNLYLFRFRPITGCALGVIGPFKPFYIKLKWFEVFYIKRKINRHLKKLNKKALSYSRRLLLENIQVN